MEHLYTTLSACLEKYGVLPEEISYGILRDVALGLRYLHERSPLIIHRDLSANNVLLTSNMNANLFKFRPHLSTYITAQNSSTSCEQL